MRQRNAVLAVALSLLFAGGAGAEPPHLDYTTEVNSVTQASTPATDGTLWDPESGNKFILMGVVISTSGAGTVELEVSNADVIPPQHFQTAGKAQIGFGASPLYVGAVDDILTYTTTQGEWSIAAYGYEARQ